MDELVIGLVITLVLVAIVACPIIAIGTVVEYNTCQSLQATSSLHYQWGFWTGCVVQVPGGAWVPWKNYLGGNVITH